jgi:4-amino-4-deoxy-L-arabinose transferase-like glycosyltransferase
MLEGTGIDRKRTSLFGENEGLAMTKKREVSKSIRCILILAWVVGIILVYFIFHKPITPSQFQNLAHVFLQFLISAWIISIAGGIGSQIITGEEEVPLIRWALQAGLGLGIFSLGILLMGIMFAYVKWLIFGVTATLSLVFWKSILGWWKRVYAVISEFREVCFFEKMLTGLIVFVFLITLISCLAPPTKFDTLVYHLTLPKYYLQEGKITYIPWLIFWGMPQVVEMLATWSIALGGPETAIVLGWMIGVITVIGLYGLIRRYFGKRAGWVSIAALLSGFTTAQSLSWGYGGWMNILLGTGFLACFLGWWRGGKEEIHFDLPWAKGNEKRYLVLAGVYAGLAFGVKYPSGTLLLIGISLILIRKKGYREKIRDVFVFWGVAFLVLSPWLVKNILATGNPLYPFIFPSGAMDAFRLARYQNPPSSEAWWDVFLLPLKSTILGKEGAPGYGASIGPLLLGLGLLGFFPKKSDPKGKVAVKKVAVVMVLVGLLIWGLAGLYSGYLVQTRLYFGIFPAMTLLAGAGYDYLSECEFKNVDLKWVMNGLILLVFIFNTMQLFIHNLEKRSILSVFSVESDQVYLDANLGWYAPAMREIRELPSGAQVLMLWEPRGYYCIPRCDPDEILDRWIHDLQKYHAPSKIIMHWMDSGYTHVLYHSKGADFVRVTDPRYDRETWLALERLWASLPDPQEIGGGYLLYKLDWK